MKKKIKKCTVPFILLLFIAMVYTSIMVNAEQQLCYTDDRTYYFNLGVTKGNTDDTNQYNETDTTFNDELPDGATFDHVEVISAESMTQQDANDYFDTILYGECETNEANNNPICNLDGKYTNSGSDDDYKFNQNTEREKVFNRMISSTTIMDANSCQSNGDGTVKCTIKRTWDSSGFSGNYYQIMSSVKLRIAYYADNCGEEENVCDMSENKNIPASLNCKNGDYEETIKRTVTVTRTKSELSAAEIEFYDKKDDAGTSPVCDNIEETITGITGVTQTGKATFNLQRTTYSGGGFHFYTNYEGKAKYEICGATGSDTGLEYTIKDEYAAYMCPPKDSEGDTTYSAGSLNEATKKCTYTSYTTDQEWDETRGRFIEVTRTGTVVEDAKQDEDGCSSTTTTYKCSTGYNHDCSNNSGEMQAFAEKMKEYLQQPTIEGSVKSKDSNEVTIPYNVADTEMAGTWNDDTVDTSAWYPGDKREYNASFRLSEARIGIYPNNVTQAPVCYNGEDDCANYIDGGNFYYVPLKWPDSTGFPVSVDVSNLSIITEMTWPLDYDCSVNCNQKMYEDKGFKFIYRPIDMSDPFPNNRQPGANWTTFMDEYDSGNNKAQNKMTRNQLEYHSILTQTDITQINSYNTRKYPDLKTITPEGKSTAITQFGINNLRGNNFNHLGKCTTEETGDKKCW